MSLDAGARGRVAAVAPAARSLAHCALAGAGFRAPARSTQSRDGGTGRRAGLKIQWGNPCRFDSDSRYHLRNATSRPDTRLRLATRAPRLHALAEKNTQAGFSSGVSLVFSGHARRSRSPIGLRSRRLVRGASATPARQVQRGGDGAPARPAPLVQLARHERAGASARRDVGGISGAEAALTR
jgi:hypothetical protein